jgi:hypothetical protein
MKNTISKKRAKGLLIVFSILFYTSIQSQDISFDRIVNNNSRHIGTKSMEVKIENAKYDFSLAVISNSNSNEYSLLISSYWMMEDNCVVMLKLGNNQNVKLTANNLNKGQIDMPVYNPIIGTPTVSGMMTTKKVDYYVSLYSLEDELLNKIKEYGITKIRITFGDSYFEKDWRKDELGRFIGKSHKAIEDQLQKPHISKKSIEEDF